jgi:hypothetical protein
VRVGEIRSQRVEISKNLAYPQLHKIDIAGIGSIAPLEKVPL